MTNYDFSSLNDKDFEVLVADLLSIEHNTRFERFKSGKDGGIDGRYFAPAGGQVIFQCKHWAKSGLTALLRSLENTEHAKVVQLNPTRYIIATSLSLSAADKAKINSIFGRFMLNDADVLGCEDINDLLRKYPHVEKSHYKLWLHSTEVLVTLTNAAILGRSTFTLQEIRERSSAYVQTASYEFAREKVKKLGVLLITGEPGIGKTTLAEQLCLEYAVEGYQLCVAARKIEELESLYREDIKQVFYFDDFLGSNFLAVLNRHEDSHIVAFIQRVSKDKNKRFILTSRSTVLNRGKSLTDRFNLARLEQHEFEIEVKSLAEIDKARILHSRMWYSDLSREYLEVIVDKQRYWQIIRHINFNPRLIAFITDSTRFKGVRPADYWTYIEKTLQNPIDVWDHVFNSQLTDWTRLVVMLVVFSGGSIEEKKLRDCYENLATSPLVQSYNGDFDFDMGMRILVGAVLNRSVGEQRVTLTLFNPSIADYVLRKISASQQKLTMVLSALSETRSFDNFLKLILNEIVSISVGNSVIDDLCRIKLPLTNENSDITYQARIGSAALEIENPSESTVRNVIAFLNRLAQIPNCAQYLNVVAPMIPYVLSNAKLPFENIGKFLFPMEEGNFDRDSLEAVAKIFPFLPNEVKTSFIKAFKPVVIDYWQDSIQDEIVDRDILENFYEFEEANAAEALIKKEIDEILSEYGIEFNSTELNSIAQYVDVSDIINRNIKQSMNDFDADDHREYVDRGANTIDDLFAFDLPDSVGE
jgi:adenylate kinase family enzyme